jgi:hypothetical protein
MADIEWLAEMHVTVPGSDAVEADADADANPDPIAVAVATPQSTAAGSVAVAVPVAVAIASPPARPGHTAGWYILIGLVAAVAVFVTMMLV